MSPDALAEYIRQLGGEPINSRQFEMPLSETRRIIPEINKLGWRCEKVSERQGTDPINGNAMSFATIELRPQLAPTEYDDERNLMRIVCR
jgi:hypothetical protein